MNFRLSTKDDLNIIIDIIDDARSLLKQNGVDQWQDGYPTVESIIKDIEDGHSWIGLNEDVPVCTLSISFEGEPTYDVIENGSWITEELPYGVIHRLAVSNNCLGKGYGQEAFLFAENLAKSKGINIMKVDTHENNSKMQELLQSLGYIYCGIIYVSYGAKRLAFEKTICLGETIPKYHTFLIDADDTLMDFVKTEEYAFKLVCSKFNVPWTQELMDEYTKVNASYWLAFEKGEVTKEQLVVRRFRDFLFEHNLPGDPEVWEQIYQDALGQGFELMPHALELCRAISKKAKLYIVTNGVESTQKSRLKGTTLENYINGAFISEAVGYQKPQEEYFDFVKNTLNLNSWEGVLIVGDSANSDILGGCLSGIDTCHYNPKNLPWTEVFLPNYSISDLRVVMGFLP
ncbi:MAG: noncanonical pyrimidine nucleotidase, YjjG family [Tissierellia bacterium]|nr:noncanonical pyrimidine nucleotidase, YjjG family [Tissierellia bacterium]